MKHKINKEEAREIASRYIENENLAIEAIDGVEFYAEEGIWHVFCSLKEDEMFNDYAGLPSSLVITLTASGEVVSSYGM